MIFNFCKHFFSHIKHVSLTREVQLDDLIFNIIHGSIKYEFIDCGLSNHQEGFNSLAKKLLQYYKLEFYQNFIG